MKTEKEVKDFLKVLVQAKEALKDFLELSKKKPDDAVNKFKLGFVNTVLEEANDTLGKGNKPFDSFKAFNEDDVPTNSDVVLILSQYVGCLKKFGRDNVAYNEHIFRDCWIIKGSVSAVEADIVMLRDK